MQADYNNKFLFSEIDRPKRTGGMIAMMHPETHLIKIEETLKQKYGNISCTYSSELHQASSYQNFNSSYDIHIFGDTNIVSFSPRLIKESRETVSSMNNKFKDIFEIVEPEYFAYGINAPYAPHPFNDTIESTWGLHATKVISSPYTGKNVKIAILDSGMDLQHPDFNNRNIISKNFTDSATMDDIACHGTHCAGTAAGHKNIANHIRYGIAYNSDLYVGKVLADNGIGTDMQILAGISWAIENKCHIISLSLGRSVRYGETFSRAYEKVAQRALEQGCLLIAAAGNESYRKVGDIQPIGSPANCPSIMSVASIDHTLQVSNFSCAALNHNTQIDVSAPGEAIISSYPSPRLHNRLDGTSMACPHVTGIAALYIEAYNIYGEALREKICQGAMPLDGTIKDLGHGLVQGPI